MTPTDTGAAQRPAPGEHAPYYAKYVARVPDGDVLHTLETQIESTMSLLRDLPESVGGKRYAEGKWSIREVIGHLCDTERVFGYRGLRFSRNDPTELPGFDENLFVANSSYDARTLASVCDEYEAVRRSSIHLLAGLSPSAWDLSGVANGARMSVRAVAWIMAGHELHHVALLKERYLA